MDQHIFVPLRRKYQFLRVKEMLSTALGGGRANIFGTAANMNGSIGDGAVEVESRRASLAQPGSARGPGPGGLPAPSRKQSVASVGTSAAVAT